MKLSDLMNSVDMMTGIQMNRLRLLAYRSQQTEMPENPAYDEREDQSGEQIEKPAKDQIEETAEARGIFAKESVANPADLPGAAKKLTGGTENLQRAVAWAEILGEPVAKKHRRRRMNR